MKLSFDMSSNQLSVVFNVGFGSVTGRDPTDGSLAFISLNDTALPGGTKKNSVRQIEGSIPLIAVVRRSS